MGQKVTDPALLQQLNGTGAPQPAPQQVAPPIPAPRPSFRSGGQPQATGAAPSQKVTDPNLLSVLNLEATADDANWERNVLLPREVNKVTGDSRLAVPGIVQGAIDAFQLPGDVLAGKVDPMSKEGIGRSLGFATTFGPGMMGRGPIGAGGIPKATKNLAEALKADGLAAADILPKLKEMGPDARVMDLGPNSQQLAGAIAAVPGRGQAVVRGAIEARSGAKARTGRVNDLLDKTIGQGPEIDLLKGDIITRQKEAAKPLYDAVRDIALPLEGNFKFVLQTPLGQDAFQEAAKLAANDGYKINGLTVGLVDYAKQALDDIAKEAARKGKDNRARQAGDMARLLRTEADKFAPGYADARAAFAGPAQLIDAIDAGYATFTKDISPPQLQRTLQGMSPSEREGYLAAAQAWVEAKVGTSSNDALAVKNTFRQPWNEQKLRILLGDDVANALLKGIDNESTKSATNSIVAGGSETARRQAAMGVVAPEVARVHAEGVVGLITRAFNAARMRMRGVTQPKINQGMAEGLTAGAETLRPEFLGELGGAMQPPRSLAGVGANAGARSLGTGFLDQQLERQRLRLP